MDPFKVHNEYLMCREQLDELSAELEECVAEHEGSECLLLCVGHMLAEIIDRLNSGLLSSTDTIAAARASVVQSMGPCTLSRTIVWYGGFFVAPTCIWQLQFVQKCHGRLAESY